MGQDEPPNAREIDIPFDKLDGSEDVLAYLAGVDATLGEHEAAIVDAQPIRDEGDGFIVAAFGDDPDRIHWHVVLVTSHWMKDSRSFYVSLTAWTTDAFTYSHGEETHVACSMMHWEMNIFDYVREYIENHPGIGAVGWVGDTEPQFNGGEYALDIQDPRGD